MEDIITLIVERCSTRAPFDPSRPVSIEDMKRIVEAARWAPTAHNMQNFEILFVDDRKVLEKLAAIKSTPQESFIRENFLQMSKSEEELKKKKVGVLGRQFPPAWQDASKLDAAVKDAKPTPLGYTIKDSPSVVIVTYDTRKRAPGSENDMLGFLGLGCVMENMWLMANSLGIGFQIMSVFSSKEIAGELKQLLGIPKHMEVGFAVRTGYPVAKVDYLRVRRDAEDFTHHNAFGNRGFD